MFIYKLVDVLNGEILRLRFMAVTLPLNSNL